MENVTPITLYRMGNASSPRMDHVRPQDIDLYDVDGETWVQAGTGGISTSEFEGPLEGRWWRLDAGYDYSPLLLVWNNYARHWSWEPAVDMRLGAFQNALKASHPSFVRVWVGDMIDIAPKALRFARLAAEQLPLFANDPEIAVIQQEEAAFRQKPARERVRRYVEISEKTAEFCLRAMKALLTEPDRFRSTEWDGNDFVFLQATTQSLTNQLARSTAQSL